MKILRISIFIFVVIILIWIIFIANGYNLIIPISNYKTIKAEYSKGEIVEPLKKMNFDKGKWTVYLKFSNTDRKELPNNIEQFSCFKTKDISLLKRMQDNWKFIYTGADIATIESQLLFFNDGKLVYETGILVNKNKEGLQSRSFGWLEGTDKKLLSDFLKDFKRVYSPIIIL